MMAKALDISPTSEGTTARAKVLLFARSSQPGVLGWILAGAGAVLLVVSALIHLHLWMTGYKDIPTIGPMFLAQVVAGLVIALVVALARRVWASLLGLALALGTIGGFLISVYIGLFGFRDSWSAPFATTAFAVELIGAVALAASVAAFAPMRRAS